MWHTASAEGMLIVHQCSHQFQPPRQVPLLFFFGDWKNIRFLEENYQKNCLNHSRSQMGGTLTMSLRPGVQKNVIAN